jgi:hypothetical protein
VVVWEGFVNEISVSTGVLTTKIGSLTNVANRVIGIYSDLQTGDRKVTAAASETVSQAKYGIFDKVISIGSASETNANEIRDVYLADHAYPRLTQSLADGSEISIELNCVGYINLLNYPYNNASEITYTLRERIIHILAADPNGVFSTDYSGIEPNTLEISIAEAENRLAYDIIKELVALGADSTAEKMLFGIYQNRKGVYKPVPATVKYTQKLSDYKISLTDDTGSAEDPWDIEVGNWVHLMELGSIEPNNLNSNPATMFIESIQFTAPYSVVISGSQVEKLP